MNDKKLIKYLVIILLVPITAAFFAGDRFRYPCQDPANWEKDMCKMPLCDVTRTCPEHIFKGQRDPRLGPPAQQSAAPAPAASQGVTCGK